MQISRALLVLSVLALPAIAQNRRPVTESYSNATLFGGFRPGDVNVVFPNGTNSLEWPHAVIGLAAGDELDAVSDGSDYFPSPGPAAGGALDCRDIFVEYTVDTGSSGGPDLIAAECADDGCASDTFGTRFVGGAELHSHESDHLAVNPLPGETDLDGLAWKRKRAYPIYFCVDVATAAANGWSPADILIQASATTAPTVWASATVLGLDPNNDVIDALAVNVQNPCETVGLPYGRVVFSLDRGSASLGVDSPADLFEPSPTGPVLWATAEQLDLNQGIDNLNGVRITDPLDFDWTDGGETDPGGWPYSTLTINDDDGGTPRRVDTPVGAPFVLKVDPLTPGAMSILYATYSIPCKAAGTTSPRWLGTMAFDPKDGILFASGTGTYTVSCLPAWGTPLSIQGRVLQPSGLWERTNMITALAICN